MKYLKKVGIIVLILSIYMNFVGGTISLALNNVTSTQEDEISNINSENIESVANNTTDNNTKDEQTGNTEDEQTETIHNNVKNEPAEILDNNNVLKENKNVENELLEEKKEDEQQLITYSETEQNGVVIGDSSNQSDIETGFYQISTALDLGKVLDIDCASKNDKANVQIWQNNGVRQQQFKVIKLDNGYYEIVNCRSTKALDVAGGGKEKRNECMAILKK